MTDYLADPLPLEEYNPSGPSRELQHRISVFQNSPAYEGLSDDEKDALHVRFAAAREFGDLTSGDQALVERGELEVSAGASSTLQDPADWGGDWAAEDAALDEGDLSAAGEAAEGDTVPEGKGFDFDELDGDGWVGV